MKIVVGATCFLKNLSVSDLDWGFMNGEKVVVKEQCGINYWCESMVDGKSGMFEPRELEVAHVMGRLFEVVSDQHRKYPDVAITLPKKGTMGAMAYDVYSPITISIPPMKPTMIWTDVKAKFNRGEGLLLNARSSMGRYPLMIASSQGLIDCDYYGNENNDGNIGVMLINFSEDTIVINATDRIAQLTLIPYLDFDNGNSTEIRCGGFGSTNGCK